MRPHTALTLIIGDPVEHSLSPSIHNAGYDALGLPFHMQKARVNAQQLTNFFGGVRAMRIAGLAITMPLKILAIPFVDRIDKAGEKIGAINTVYRGADGALLGSNTDWIGIANPLKAKVSLPGLRVAIVGAGGAALAALFACSEASARITLFNRSEEKARHLCSFWGVNFEPLSNISLLSDYDVVINATPVGMTHIDSESQNDLYSHLTFKREQILFETIYSPLHTAFILRGREFGATTITGDEMFVEQAIAQFALHTGTPAPRDTLTSALRSNLM